MEQVSRTVLAELAPTRVLRAAINLGNPVLARKDAVTGDLHGVSVDIARELADRLAVPLATVEFDAAGKVFEAVKTGRLDVVFLAVDPLRAEEVLFTSPYVLIEGTYIVRESSPLRRLDDFDAPGVRIAVGKGAAYDLFLSRSLQHAQLVRADTSEHAIDLFIEADLDAAAGVKQPLQRFAKARPGFRVIEESFMTIHQAIGTPRGRDTAREFLQSFVEGLKADGFVAEALARSGQQDVTVAPL